MSSCSCIKDHTITCRVHPHEYQQIEVMGKHIAKLEAELVEKENAIYQHNVWLSEATKEVE